MRHNYMLVSVIHARKVIRSKEESESDCSCQASLYWKKTRREMQLNALGRQNSWQPAKNTKLYYGILQA